jgi:hypothetical protein
VPGESHVRLHHHWRWLGRLRRRPNNEREIEALIERSRANPQTSSASSPATKRSCATELETVPSCTLIWIACAAALKIPVSTAEPWHVWLRPAGAWPNTSISSRCICCRIGKACPSRQRSITRLQRYAEVRQRFPDKPVVIGEIGWPSHGDRLRRRRTPARMQSGSLFVRAFLEPESSRSSTSTTT